LIRPDTRIASAGSCFAQHISRALRERGYHYLVTEEAPATLPPELAARWQYGVFSARYGNIYTPLQLLQLLQRALGRFVPADQIWEGPGGRFYDLLRPRIVPRGYSSLAELEADLRHHLSAVETMIHETQVLVFTLGLTEAWLSCHDGTVYPTCPGCGSAGDYDPARYRFHNFKAGETIEHLGAAISLLGEANPRIQIVLTVSPVPLAATMASRHVLQATTYSKSVLRVAAEDMVTKFENVHYFASYELITATCNTEAFFADDRRTITPAGVACAMDCFFRQFARYEGASARPPSEAGTKDATPCGAPLQAEQTICDEDEFFRAVAEQRRL
jgi:hypothetical protein